MLNLCLKTLTVLGLGVFIFMFSSFNIYVSTTGNDKNAGSESAPKATLRAALRQAREMRRLNAEGIENGINIILREGTYYFYEPLYVRPEDSGTSQSPTTICGATGEKAVISGGIEIKDWKKSGKYFVADVPSFNGRPLDFRQLWVNGKKAVRARDVADFNNMARIIRNDKQNQVLWVPAKAVKAIQNAPYAEMLLHQMWAVSFLRIKSVEIHGDSAAVRFQNPESVLQFERPWPQPMVAPGRNSAFYLTNAIELLDQPGEWYHDIRSHKLYYYPVAGETIKNAVVPAIETLIEIEGTADRQVQNIAFKNMQFSHTSWMRPSEKGHVPLQAGMYLTEAYRLNPQMDRPDNHKLDNQGWLGRPAAAITVIASGNIDFENCRFEHLGSTGLDYVSGNNGAKVYGCLFRDIAGNGLLLGSFSPPSLETHLPYVPADQREICKNQQISNNLFTDIANEDWGCVAIGAGYVNSVNIEHNEINNVSYTGISVGWGWNRSFSCMGNNRVFANNIHHYAKHMYDVAAVYTLGSQPGTVVSNNYIHDIYQPSYAHDPNHWFYLYTDEGSSFITVKNNWVPAAKFLQNANGPGNNWENNNQLVDDSVKQNAGIRYAEFDPLIETVTDTTCKLQEIPHFAAIEFVTTAFDINKAQSIAKANGVIHPQFFQWKNHVLLYAPMNRITVLETEFEKAFPAVNIVAYDQALYNFSRREHCKNSNSATEWEHIIFTANLVDNAKMQQEYVDYHKTQFEKWPEVSSGFCNAGFQQLQVFKNKRQLLLVISIPKGSSLDELNPKTTENNPRVDDWNALMKNYQTGIEGTNPGEVWVELKKINQQ